MKGQPSQTPHVAIVGCGISGLRCADVLLQSGANVTIFEARDRVGGRVYQLETGGILVDVGANWVHEPNNNPILQLAKQSDTVTFERPVQQATFDRYGNRIPDKMAMRLKATLWDLVEEAEEYSLNHSCQIDAQESVLDYLREKVSERYLDEPGFIEALLDESQRLGQFFGDPVDTMSLKFACTEEGTGGKDLFMASTYKNILDFLERRIHSKCTLRLSTEVIHINAEVDRDSKVWVQTSSGDSEAFDEVVVSCPLGWLKRNKDKAFSPSLPRRLSEAIDNVRYSIHH